MILLSAWDNLAFVLVLGLFLNLRWVHGIGVSANPLPKEHVETQVKEESSSSSKSEKAESTLSIVVVGASGELARKKIFPSLFALFYEDRLPKVPLYTALPFSFQKPLINNWFFTSLVVFIQNFTIFGYARSTMTDEELRNMISRGLTCRIDKRCHVLF